MVKAVHLKNKFENGIFSVTTRGASCCDRKDPERTNSNYWSLPHLRKTATTFGEEKGKQLNLS